MHARTRTSAACYRRTSLPCPALKHCYFSTAGLSLQPPTPQLVIEEVSMLDGVLLDKLDAIARRLRIRETNTPMGQGHGMAATLPRCTGSTRTFSSAP